MFEGDEFQVGVLIGCVFGYMAGTDRVVVRLEGPADIRFGMEPQDARALAAQLIAAADYAEGVSNG